MQLVIAADVSTSMDAEEKALQQRGFVEAFRRPEIIEAIAAGRHGRIAVTYVEWGGDGQRRLVMPWTIITNEIDSWMFSLKLEVSLPAKIRRGTSISGILSYPDYLIRSSGYEATRSLINISGDGLNNKGRDVMPAAPASLPAASPSMPYLLCMADCWAMKERSYRPKTCLPISGAR